MTYMLLIFLHPTIPTIHLSFRPHSHHALAQVVYRQTDRMMDALAAIEKFTGTEIFNYVQFNFKNLLQELLWWPTDDASWGAPGSPVPSTVRSFDPSRTRSKSNQWLFVFASCSSFVVHFPHAICFVV